MVVLKVEASFPSPWPELPLSCLEDLFKNTRKQEHLTKGSSFFSVRFFLVIVVPIAGEIGCSPNFRQRNQQTYHF